MFFITCGYSENETVECFIFNFGSPVDALTGSSLLTALVEQAGLRQSELDSHPVRTAMKQLLQYLDQLCPFEPDSAPGRPDYIRNFLDYVNVLASVLVRSLGSDGKKKYSNKPRL